MKKLLSKIAKIASSFALLFPRNDKRNLLSLRAKGRLTSRSEAIPLFARLLRLPTFRQGPRNDKVGKFYNKIRDCFVATLLAMTLYLFFFNFPTNAQDFRNDYQVDYFLSEQENGLNTKVKFSVKITNYRTDVYVKQFSIGFPKSFIIRDIRAYDDHVELAPQLDSDNEDTKITLEFSNPNVGRNSVNNFYLEFFQDNLFTLNGNVWEVIIPTIAGRKDGSYQIFVHLPDTTSKKISISKPRPDSIIGNVISWNNPQTKTIYAVFGDNQYYSTELIYNLKNTQLVPVYTDIAFPPDTLYQKIYIEKIDPLPASVYLDEDGNYLGRYFLKPRESHPVNFKGTIQVLSNPREDIIPNIRDNFSKQKNYLLSETKYWTIANLEKIQNIPSNPKNIYDYVISSLVYNYNKVNTSNKRLGAEGAISEPTNAVCMEFTDLFVAISRKKDIYSREIEGYGFSHDPQLRPLSLVSDILHSWPEYYDTKLGLWTPVDPTWEDTSGIDYFSAFDLNHIVFAIHAKNSDYPFPAGTYKTENSQDVSIVATRKVPTERNNLTIDSPRFPSQINDSQMYQAKLTVTNQGNTYVWNRTFPIFANNLEINPSSLVIATLAPYGKNIFVITFKAKEKNKWSNGNINIAFPSQNIKAEFKIIPFYHELAVKISLGLLATFGILFILILVRKSHSHARIHSNK